MRLQGPACYYCCNIIFRGDLASPIGHTEQPGALYLHARPAKKLVASRRSYWSRLAFRPHGLFGKNATIIRS